jgi:hypothetical protein
MVTPTSQYADFTLDAETVEDILATVIAFESEALSQGFQPFGTALVAASAVNGLAAPGPTASAPAPAASTAGEVEVPADQGQPGQLAKRFRLAVIEITPRQDDKAQVAFYGDDIKPPMNQYPYVTNVYTSKTWVQKFAAITAFDLDDFRKAQRFAIVADVVVRFGNKRAQEGAGNYYRNIAEIVAVQGVGMQEVTTFEAAPEPQAAAPSEPEDIPF